MNDKMRDSNSRSTETMIMPTETMGRLTEMMDVQNSNRPTETLRDISSRSELQHITIGSEINGYSLIEVISENTGEASIFLGQRDGQEFVLKLYHKNKRPKLEIMEKVKSISSPFVISIIEEGEFGNRFYEVLPYFSEKDLQSSNIVNEDFLINTVIPNVNEGLFELHSKGIIHRDIKPNNLFYSNDREHIIIGDFGISSLLNSGMSVRMTSTSRTPGYSAPETAQGIISKEVDYYSFGITLLHLVTGRDPFEGMTDAQILMQTLNYKIPIPQRINPRISQIIRGLIVKDRLDRWGYDEIEKWLNNENVPIKEMITRNLNTKPYFFEGEKLNDLPSLAHGLATHWNEGIKQLYRGLITEHLKQFGQDLTSKSMDYMEETDHDIGLFKLIYLLDPQAPLCWRGEVFTDLHRFTDKCVNDLPSINDNYFALFVSGAFIEYLRKKNIDPEFIQAFSKISELDKEQHREEIYYQAVLLLQSSIESNGIVFKFSNEMFYSPDDVVEYLMKNQEDLDQISLDLLTDKYFLIWLEYLGFKDEIESWKQIYG